jgi:hypothetical protein
VYQRIEPDTVNHEFLASDISNHFSVMKPEGRSTGVAAEVTGTLAKPAKPAFFDKPDS